MEANRKTPFLSREELKGSKRIVIKLGSSVVTREDRHGLALARLAAIVEQVSELQSTGSQCILVTSGAMAAGQHKLAKFRENLLADQTQANGDQMNSDQGQLGGNRKQLCSDRSQERRTNAAVGQVGLMSLYETMFRNHGLDIGQLLLIKRDFRDARDQVYNTIRDLLLLNIVPIVNTNDVVDVNTNNMVDVSTNNGSVCVSEGLKITDNDSVACSIAVEVGADLVILMSDVEGIYDKPPSHEGAKLLDYVTPKDLHNILFAGTSAVGTGGMQSKVESGSYALEHGCSAVICSGLNFNTIRNIMSGMKVGTMFTPLETAEYTTKAAQRGIF